jgi:hypothetical protein
VREWGVTLDWLVLGIPPRVRGLQQKETDLAQALRMYLLASLRPTRKGRSRRFLERGLRMGEELLKHVVELVEKPVADAERTSRESIKMLMRTKLIDRLSKPGGAEAQKWLRALVGRGIQVSLSLGGFL